MSGFSPAQALIAAMITPALLIMASASLIATALVRLGRVVDRVRKLSEHRDANVAARELRRHRRRALLAEYAVSLYFLAVLCFVVDGFAIAVDHLAADNLTWLPVLVTTFGMCLIVAGSAVMLAECQLSARQIRDEITMLLAPDQPRDG